MGCLNKGSYCPWKTQENGLEPKDCEKLSAKNYYARLKIVEIDLRLRYDWGTIDQKSVALSAVDCVFLFPWPVISSRTGHFGHCDIVISDLYTLHYIAHSALIIGADVATSTRYMVAVGEIMVP